MAKAGMKVLDGRNPDSPRRGPPVGIQRMSSSPHKAPNDPQEANAEISHLIDREAADRKEAVAEVKLDFSLLQTKVSQISDVLQEFASEQDVSRSLQKVTNSYEDLQQEMTNCYFKLHKGLGDETITREQAMEKLAASLNETMLKELAKAVASMQEEQSKTIGSIEPLVTDLFNEHLAETQRIADEQCRFQVSLDALHDSAAMTREREMEISTALNERIDGVSHRNTSLHEEIVAFANQLRISERKESDMQNDLASIRAQLAEQDRMREDVQARLTQRVISNDAMSIELDQLKRYVEHVASVDQDFKQQLEERLELLQGNVALTDDLQERLELHDQFKAKTTKLFTDTSCRIDSWCERTQKQSEDFAKQFKDVEDDNQYLSETMNKKYNSSFTEIKDELRALGTTLGNQESESQKVGANITWRLQNQSEEFKRMRERIDALSGTVTELSDDCAVVKGKVGELSDACKVVAAQQEVVAARVESFPAGTWDEVLAVVTGKRERAEKQVGVSPRGENRRESPKERMLDKSCSSTTTPERQTSPRYATSKASGTKSSPESSLGFMENATPWTPPPSGKCEPERHMSEEQEENFRQQYLRLVPTVSLRNAVSQHQTAWPWSEKTWMQRVKIAREVLPSLQ